MVVCRAASVIPLRHPLCRSSVPTRARRHVSRGEERGDPRQLVTTRPRLPRDPCDLATSQPLQLGANAPRPMSAVRNRPCPAEAKKSTVMVFSFPVNGQSLLNRHVIAARATKSKPIAWKFCSGLVEAKDIAARGQGTELKTCHLPSAPLDLPCGRRHDTCCVGDQSPSRDSFSTCRKCVSDPTASSARSLSRRRRLKTDRFQRSGSFLSRQLGLSS